MAMKKRSRGEFTYTEMVRVCDMLGLTLDEAAAGAVVEGSS